MQSCPNVYKLVFTVIRFFTVVPFLLLVVFTPTRALASINQTINFQGKLVDSSGLNVPDGTQYELTFKLYNVSSSGTAIWTEVQGNVSVTSGIFQVQLGSVTPLTQVDFNNSNLYLGITVSKNGTGGATGESEMTPRIQFTGVPYAFNAASLQGVVATQSATGFTLTGGYQNPKTLTLNDNITIGLTITPTSSNVLTVKSNGANGLTLDTGGAAAIGIGASANTINIGNNTFANNTAVTITTGGSGIVTIGSNTGTGNILLQPNAGGQAALVVNDQGAGDIFTASAGALTKFTVANNGNISATGTLTGLTGVTLASGGITLGGTVGTGSQCLLGGATASWGSCGTGLWNLTSGALTPWYSTNDLLIGGTSTASADFAVLNVNGPGIAIATVSGNLIVMPNNGVGGKIGIGTITPTNTVEISGSGTNYGLRISSPNDGNVGLELYRPGNGFGSFRIFDSFGVLNFEGSNDGFKTMLTGLQVTASGKVGIQYPAQDGNELASLDVRAASGIIPIASFSGQTLFASLLVDQSGTGDIFTASQSGGTRFTIAANGNITDSNYAIAGGILYGTSTGLLQITGAGNSSQCLVGGINPSWGSCGSGSSPFKELIGVNGGVVVPLNTTEDFLVGGISTASAKFAVLNVNGTGPATATVSGNFIIMPTNGAGGSLGIGTTAPTSKLDVEGGSVTVNNSTSQSTSALTLVNTVGDGPEIKFNDATNNNSMYIRQQNGSLQFINNAYTWILDSFQNSGDVYLAQTAGKVGIGGITSPAGNLQVVSDISPVYGLTVGQEANAQLIVSGKTNSHKQLRLAFDTTNNVGVIQATIFGTSTNNLLLNPDGGSVGVGTANPLAELGVQGTVYTSPVASISGATGQATLVLDQSGVGDIFTASQSGGTRFVIASNGNITTTGNLLFNSNAGIDTSVASGILNIASGANTSVLNLGKSGGTINLPNFTTNNNSVLYTGASGVLSAATTTNTGSCLVSNGAGAGPSWGSCSGTSLWNLTAGALTPWYSTNDLLIGGTSTASADFAVLNVNSGIPTATVSGNLIVMPHNGGGGSLGIDTASPQYTLDVAGTTAAFNSGKNASLTSFSTNGTTLPAARDRGASVIANGYVYYFGGDSGSSGSPLTNVYYAPLNANGSINAWVSTTSLPDSGHNALTAVAANNYIYILGGNDGVGLSSDNYVYYAHINADGSLGAWIKNNYSMVTAVRGHTSVIANGYIYAIGGKDSFSTVKNTVQFAKIYPDGSTGPWTTTTNLPVALMYASSVVANNYLYVLGGYDGTNALTPVYYGKLNADGTISSWLTTNALPQADMASGAVVANGNVYVVGGATGTAGTVLNTIIYAPFNSNGSLGSWTTNGSTLPTAKTYIENSVVTANGYVYAIGGTTDAAGTVPASSIYYSSTARVSLAGDLDLLGFNSASLSAVSGDTGSSIYAGNIYSNNSLNVHGTTQLWDIFSANNGGVINNQLQISGGTNGGNALLVVNQQGASANDIFTASSSGTTKFTIANSGNISTTGTITGLTGITLVSGGITLGGTVGTGSQCLLGGSTASWGSCGSGSSPFKEVTTNGTIVPFNNTEDFLIGGIATQGANFAEFAFTNVNPGSGTPTASISAGVTGALLLDAGGNIQTTAKQTLTIGGGNSGNVILSPSGNVGIGGSPLVNSINFKLAIAGSAAITGANTLSFYQDTTTRNGTIGGGSSQFIFNAVNSSIFAFQVGGSEKMRLDTNGNLGIGATSPLATLDIRSNFITSPVASISGDTGKATFIIDQRGIGDIFTASQSGGTRFTIGQNGNITDSNYAVAGGILYGTSTGLMQITGAGNSSQCLVGGAVPTWGSCATGTVVSPFKEVTTNGIIVPLNATEDFLVGGISSSSADFAFLNVAGGTPTASISAGVANSGRGLYITGTGTIATTANQNLVLGANTGISNVQVTPNAGGQAALIVNDQGVGDLFTASAAATTRFIVHNNGSLQLAGSTGSDITTITGGNGLTIAPKTNASGAGGGLTLNAGNGTGGVGGNVSIDAGTGSANGTVSVGTANATSISLGNANTTITFGTGGNTVQFTTGAGLVYAGTARLNKTIVLSAEYAGAVLTASGSATTTGSMTSDASSSATLVSNGTNIWKTFYSWTSSTASPLQDYTVAVRVTLPQDFSDWQTNAITIDYDTMDVSAANNALDVYIYNPNATNKNVPVYFKTGNVVGNWDSWGTLTINKTGVEDTIDPDWATAGQSAVIYLKMRAMNNNHVLISDIKLNYLSKF